MARKELTTRQQIAVMEYICTGNMTQAYKFAGYKCKDDNTAQSTASQFFSRPKIQQAVEREQRKLQARLDLKVERVLHEYACIAFSDRRNVHNADGSYKGMDEWDDDTAAAVKDVEFFEDGRIKDVHFWDKIPALEKLGKHLSLFSEKNVQEAIRAATVNVQVNVAELSKLSVEDLEAILDLQQRAAGALSTLHSEGSAGDTEGTAPPVIQQVRP